jgi:hypothetical protein
MMTPTAWKFMKFCTTPVNMKRMPSTVSRLRAIVVIFSILWVSGLITS